MINNQELEQRLVRLEKHLEKQQEFNENVKEKINVRQGDNSATIAKAMIKIVHLVLLLIALAVMARAVIEYLRLPATPAAPINQPILVPADSAITRRPTEASSAERSGVPATPPSSTEPLPAKRALDDYIDRHASKSTGGNTYWINLQGLDALVNGFVRTGQLTVEKGASLMHELGKHAIATTGEILKETAKAIIAAQLEPQATPNAGITQQVQVTVFTSEKKPAVITPKKPVPAAPAPRCPTPVSERKANSCPADATALPAKEAATSSSGSV